MPLDVQQFRSEIVFDGARPNQYEVIIALPSSGIASIGNDAESVRKFRFFCRTAQLPGNTFGMAPMYYMGRELKLPGNRQFPEWMVTVYNDEDFIIRNTMEKWMDGLNSHLGNTRDPSAMNNLDYTADCKITQLSKRGPNNTQTGLKTYNMIGAWPMDLSPIDVDYGQNDMIEEFTITWAYQWWETVGDGITT